MKTKAQKLQEQRSLAPPGRVGNEICAAAARGIGQISRWLTGEMGETPTFTIHGGTEFSVTGGGRTFVVSIKEEPAEEAE